MAFFIQGLMLGFAYVAPIGVQNMFVINTAMTQRRRRVYATAFIVMFFDITLAVACFFGVGAIMKASLWLELIVLGVGSIIVILMGISLVRAHDTMDTSTKVDIPILKVIAQACVVTWFNPQALIDGSMMLGAFRASLPGAKGTLFIIGVSIASMCWWLGLSTVVSLLSTKITDKMLRVVNVVCGIIIMFYGCKLAWSFIELAMKMFG
ncbi:LysE/ArgO family amino acid transporter [Aminicella lysinilytica]|uniref:L-lysine exporter family protein LysE/ArgO n=1 Tax=Aminicella lysinilytica TaxID=433323 RepID=A0A4R6Q0Y6_9FIRM|nr:LysE family transporter [Aminicella lysinilytica]TDP52873.1 L-lysine exporter family protein LysE/ArgO [Aminicella lysinilytica]